MFILIFIMLQFCNLNCNISLTNLVAYFFLCDVDICFFVLYTLRIQSMAIISFCSVNPLAWNADNFFHQGEVFFCSNGLTKLCQCVYEKN